MPYGWRPSAQGFPVRKKSRDARASCCEGRAHAKKRKQRNAWQAFVPIALAAILPFYFPLHFFPILFPIFFPLREIFILSFAQIVGELKKMATETDIDTEGAISSDEEHAHSHENMSPEEEHAHMIDNFKKAGKLTAKVREDGKRLIVPGESLFDVAESVEKFMAEAGIRMGFPANISLNNAAAHFTPEIGCETLLGEKDVVKLDIGGQVEGCVGDTACTIDLSDEWGK